MTSPLTLHAGPAVGFDQPFEMLAACHERVRRSLDLLLRLQAHVSRHGVDAQARDAAADVLRYFDLAGPAHHEDEERHVLPRLRATGRGELADRLSADHAEMGRQWAALRTALECIARGDAVDLDAHACAAYAALYAGHMAVEETQAFAHAASQLDETARAAMGAEMAARRRG
ncbi:MULTISPECIES: hemerythrin domain-containing protein [Roseateles]|uniref:Hemerythrin domain-containing protein n=1 Tax=Pelomonas caseinilytica TaxID=2906763 RepID=A0ABS8XKI7_9BURK|nr:MULTISPECIES: hemerythrin domain-containing protein [unclassified Roseateles]MCE4539356.1 hemerythrin domain-containing protein [Pelomonas sp. P7]HEV6965205.1 hemerythrin domain-containing protein [Roseateles sp.]